MLASGRFPLGWLDYIGLCNVWLGSANAALVNFKIQPNMKNNLFNSVFPHACVGAVGLVRLYLVM